ncbi:GGDEF domain-containing protein [Glaciimonas sp. GG7]
MEPQRLNKINGLTRRMLLWTAFSYALDTVLLAVFAHIGALPGNIALMYGGMGLILNGGFYLLVVSGYNRTLKDPGMAFAQVMASTLGQIGFVILAPEIGYLFLFNLFTVYAFGGAALSSVRYFMTWLIGALALGCAFYLVGAQLGMPVGSAHGRLLIYLTLVLTLGRCVFLAAFLGRIRERISTKNRALLLAMRRVKELATRDELTNTENRRSLNAILAVEQKRFQRGGTPFCIAMLDLDGFKNVNDCFGHPVGDEVLKAFVQIVRDEMRLSDHFARYGGDEFVLVLTGTTEQESLVALERICDQTAMFDWNQFGIGIVVTTSIGVTDFHAGETVASAFQRADIALYAAKSAGRNRVVASSSTDATVSSTDAIAA